MKIDNFTLVILVRDRQHNLPNLSEYYKDLSCKKIIFDSSLTPYEPRPLEERGFEYIYFGPMTYWEKMFKVSSMVDTKFILDNPDDDITLKSSIKKCVEFLAKNENYNLCLGESARYNLGTKSIHVCPNHFGGYAGAIVEDFESDSAKERVRFNFSKCSVAVNHGVLRTKDVKDLFSFFHNNDDFKNVSLLERCFQSYTASKGNRKMLPLMYQLRREGDSRLIDWKGLRKELTPKNHFQIGGHQPLDSHWWVTWASRADNIKIFHKLFAPEISFDDLSNILKNRYGMGYRGSKNISGIKTNIGPRVAKEMGSIFNVQFEI